MRFGDVPRCPNRCRKGIEVNFCCEIVYKKVIELHASRLRFQPTSANTHLSTI